MSNSISRGPARMAVAVFLSSTIAGAWLAPALAIPERGVGGERTDLVPPGVAPLAEGAGPAHLVVSEVVTGGASASDELIELYNPSAAARSLDGLELIYVSASGTTISRRAAWDEAVPAVPPGAHLLVANSAGIYATIADATYTSGMAATGGSVALRLLGADTAIDGLGWGTAAGGWLEGSAAPAPAAGSSLERVPGGASGSTQDTDDNAADFAMRDVPDPQNSASDVVLPPDPGGTPSPTASATPEPSVAPTASPTGTAAATPTPAPTLAPTPTATPEATATPTSIPTPTATPVPTLTPPPTPDPTATPAAIPIADARSLPDGSVAVIEGIALTGFDFADGGGFAADASGGIAVLVTDGTFARGDRLRLTGTVSDRYRQRTLRVEAAGIEKIGSGPDPEALARSTGTIDESVEGALVEIDAVIVSGPDSLTGGIAFGVDDGSGEVRLLINATSGIATSGWEAGTGVRLVGVVGQRDSSGTGLEGYRVQPRDQADVLLVVAPAEPTPTPTLSPTPAPTRTPSPSTTATPISTASATPTPESGGPLVTIASARNAELNARLRIRGIVTSPTGRIEPGSAVIQDATAAILLRVGDDVGALVRGTLVEVDGTRSTKAGMLSLRVTVPARTLGTQPEPVALRVATGSAGESREAQLITVRGAVTEAPRRSSAGSTSFAIDDGSGELRVFLSSASGMSATGIEAGVWVEIVGVLGQDTTGSQPLRGYRVLPRDAADLRIVAPATSGTPGGGGQGSGEAEPGVPVFDAEIQDLTEVGQRDGAPVGATLVAGPWSELELAGLLWDGSHLVGIRAGADAEAAVAGIASRGVLPATVGVVATPTGEEIDGLGIELVALEADGALVPASGTPAVAEAALGDGTPAWVTVAGRLSRLDGAPALELAGEHAVLDLRCSDVRRAAVPAGGSASVTGIGIGGDDPRIIVPCGGVHRGPQLVSAGVKGRATLAATRGAHNGATATAAAVVPSGGAVPFLVLLAVASIALVGCLAVAWQQGALARWGAALGLPIGAPATAAEPVGEAAEDPPDAPSEEAPRPAELPAVPRLSVVSVREHPD